MANTTSLSGFPATIDSFDRVSDLDEETLAKSEIYKNLINNGDYDDAEQYLEDNPDLAQCAIDATMINKHSDAIVAIEEDVNNIKKKKISHYGVCSTSSSTNIKTVTIDDIVITDGVEVTIKFTNNLGDPSMETVYLNVNNTINGIIRYKNQNLPGGYVLVNNPHYQPSIKANQIITLRFRDEDVVCWDVVGNLDNAGSCLFLNLNGTTHQYTPGQNNVKAIDLDSDAIGAASYSEGTWTPSLSYKSTDPEEGGAIITPSLTASGRYKKVSSITYFTLKFTITALNGNEMLLYYPDRLYVTLPFLGFTSDNYTQMGMATCKYSGDWYVNYPPDESKRVDTNIFHNVPIEIYCNGTSNKFVLKCNNDYDNYVRMIRLNGSVEITGWYFNN